MKPKPSGVKILMKVGLSLLAAVFLSVLLFMVLPITQSLREYLKDAVVRGIDVAQLPPPPPPPEIQEEEEEEEEEEEPPELENEPEPLSLDQIELALNPGIGGTGGDFAVKLNLGDLISKSISENLDEAFSAGDLDQGPQPVLQTPPTYPQELQKQKKEGRVIVTFVVDAKGRVQQPKVSQSTHPAFNRPAITAIKQWKFKPGVRDGTAVAAKMKVPIKFVPN